MLECSALPTTVPIAISYRPKANDYLPVVVAAIRRFLGDWPIVLLTQARHLPPPAWLEAWHVDTITDWAHSDNANKVLRLWEHQEIFAAHFPHRGCGIWPERGRTKSFPTGMCGCGIRSGFSRVYPCLLTIRSVTFQG